MEFFGGHSVKDLSGFHKMVKKAQEIEESKIKDFK
jgi:quinone-modifying oxidoreductase subunit QmoC